MDANRRALFFISFWSTTGEFARLVANATARLLPAQREILRRRNGLDHCFGDIATALGIKIGTVKSRTRAA